MKVVKTIGFWLAYSLMVVIKLPFTLMVALTMWIEMICMCTLARLAKWYGNTAIIEDVNDAFQVTADASNYISNEYLDMKIEL